ncbi:hypothetical protein [Haloactinospora alba]|uniref:hypothetical protein n=1 Tax=Haloactinospora alba TaxID=405555 RepID=UPI00114EA158|nr:hypothetical protein [Haloactinospora alba]
MSTNGRQGGSDERSNTWKEQDPPVPAFRRLDSLFALVKLDPYRIRDQYNDQSSEDDGDKSEQEGEPQDQDTGQSREDARSEGKQNNNLNAQDRKIYVHVINALWGQQPPKPDVPWSRRLWRFKKWLYWVLAWATSVSFGKLDEKVLSPLSFIVTSVASVGVPSIAAAFGNFNTFVTVSAAVLLMLLNTALWFLVLFPWRKYVWLQKQPHSLREPQNGAEPNGTRHYREVGVRVLNAYHEKTNKNQAFDAEDPPDIQKLAVNALLSDLEDAYGISRWRHRWPWPRRQRFRLPTLIADVRHLSEAEVHLLRLIERARLSWKFPDPLVVTLVRPRGQPLPAGIAGDVAARARRDARKEKEGAIQPPEVREWRRVRYLIGRVGQQRTLTMAVDTASAKGEVEPDRHFAYTKAMLALRTSAYTGCALSAVVTLLAAGSLTAHALNPCVQGAALTPPSDVDNRGKECVGLTDGSFAFDDRLERVQQRIAEENEAVEKSDEPYVTVVYLGAMSREGGSADGGNGDSDALAGVHGELAGLAVRQREHNEDRSGTGDDPSPALRVLLANTGARWQHGREVARLVAERARDPERAGDERIVAAVGFGQSLEPTTEAVRELTRAAIPMVGSTTTFDGIAEMETGGSSPFFYPVAPSNTRIATQAAHWARYGASPAEEGSAGHRLEPADTAVALADDTQDESYGVDLASTFMREFSTRGGQAYQQRGAAPHTTAGGEELPEGVVPYGAEAGRTLGERIERICRTDPTPDVVYYAGRSDEFGQLYGNLPRNGACADGMTVIGSDDIAKYITDHIENLSENTGDFPVFYTPLAASDTRSNTSELNEDGFYSELDTFTAEELDLGEENPGRERPSTAHAVMANDTLTVVARAATRAGLADMEHRGDWETPTYLDVELRATERVAGVSGVLGFGGEEDRWKDDKLVQLVQAGPRQEQQFIAACGRITPSTGDTGPNCYR